MDEEHTTIDDAEEAFMKAFDDETPEVDDDEEEVEEVDEDEESEEGDEESEEESEEDESDDDDDEEEGDEKESDDEDDEEVPTADPDSFVEVTVDGETQKLKVSELTRLAGQEAALTQRSQAVANQRRTMDAQGLYLSNILEQRYNAALERAKKYESVDLYRASRELSDEDFDALRADKEAAEAELNTITQEGKEFIQQANNARSVLLQEQAKAAVPVIRSAIPDWNDQIYSDIRNYAVSQGMDQGTVNETVDPGLIIMMHKAMQFDKASKGAETVKQKVKKAPKRVAGKSTKVTNAKEVNARKARQRAAQSGDIDDILDVFLSDQE